MRKIILFFTLISSIANAQITITSSEMPQSAQMYFYSLSTDFSSVDVSLTGTNYSWDYSSITSAAQDTMVIASVSSTPLAYQVNFNNPFSSAYYADYAVKGRELNAFNQVTITDRYDFYKVNSSSLQVVGFGANVNGLPMSVKYDTIDQIYPLPMTYGTTDSTTAYYLITIPSLGTYGQWIRRKVEVDGWGAITTPYATYSNTIRVKTTLYQKDTMYVDQFMVGTNLDRPVEYIYEWYETAQGAPVFKAVERAGTLTEIRYMDTINTSGVEELTRNIDVYPNPVKDVLHVQLDEVYSYRLFDMEGRIVLSAQNVTSKEINLSDVTPGLYAMKIITDTGSKSIQVIKE